MGMHFSQKRGREFFLRSAGGENVLQKFENHFSKKWPFSEKEEDVLKRFFVREPEGRDLLIKHLDKNPDVSLEIKSFDVTPKQDIAGMSIFLSSNYMLKEHAQKGLILVEQKACLIDMDKYVF